MIKKHNTQSLDEFVQNLPSHLDRLRTSGEPEVYTTEGYRRIVIQDADAYERMLQVIDEAEAIRILHERLAAVDQGEPLIPADVVLEDIRRELGLDES